MKSLISKKSQRGYSLIELSIALAIVGVVIAGSIVGVQAILRSNNVNKTISQTNTAVNKVIGKLLRDTDYSGATTQILSRNGQEVWSPDYIQSGGQPTVRVSHPLNGRIFVSPNSTDVDGIIAGQGFIYTLTTVPVAACADVAVGLEGLSYTMAVSNTTAIPAADPTTLTGTIVKKPGLKFSSNTVSQECASGANPTEQATISFLVPRR